MNKSEQILLIQLFSNGDCLYATTVARQIKAENPSCKLSWAIADYCKDIIRNNPYVDEIVPIEGMHFSNWKMLWPNFMKQVKEWKASGRFDKVVFTQIIENNFSNYDYGIRSAIFRGYSGRITVPITPVLKLTKEELLKVEEFARHNRLTDFKNVVLLEFAPKSGQAKFSLESALELVGRLDNVPSTAYILSSNTTIAEKASNVIDGSILTLRETAALSKYCTLLIGCSSGITWVSTSEAGKKLDMIQILDPNSYWVNSLCNDHARFGLSTNHVVEITDQDWERIVACARMSLTEGIAAAKEKFHTDIPPNFKISRGIISYLLGKGSLNLAIKHAKINLRIFGYRTKLVKSIILGFSIFPVTNFLTYWKSRKKS